MQHSWTEKNGGWLRAKSEVVAFDRNGSVLDKTTYAIEDVEAAEPSPVAAAWRRIKSDATLTKTVALVLPRTAGAQSSSCNIRRTRIIGYYVCVIISAWTGNIVGFIGCGGYLIAEVFAYTLSGCVNTRCYNDPETPENRGVRRGHSGTGDHRGGSLERRRGIHIHRGI